MKTFEDRVDISLISILSLADLLLSLGTSGLFFAAIILVGASPASRRIKINRCFLMASEFGNGVLRGKNSFYPVKTTLLNTG
jgi:hypothetical protein